MDTMTKQSKTSSVSDPQCKWCGKSFKSERTLAVHMCPRKRRWADRDLTHIRLGYRVFQLFYELNTSATKSKSMEDFTRSQYYEGFTKFGRSCVLNEYLQPEKFAEWLIKEGKKLADWSKDSVYDEFLLQYVKKEPGLKALERNVIYLSEWGTENNCDWQDYFKLVSSARAVHDLRSAKISPWLLYLSETGDALLTRLNDEQVGMVNHVIDAKFWLSVFAKNPEEVERIQSTCKEAGI